jgi:hypothetical protein
MVPCVKKKDPIGIVFLILHNLFFVMSIPVFLFMHALLFVVITCYELSMSGSMLNYLNGIHTHHGYTTLVSFGSLRNFGGKMEPFIICR